VQRPLALVVVGGMIFAPVMILTVLPVLIDMFSRRAAAYERMSAESAD
jgi:cobalt-zinc-cadmium resistance protein CzcA